MSYIPSNQPTNPYQAPMPQAGNQAQPVVYRPGVPQAGTVMPPDSYRSGMPPTAPQQRNPQTGRTGTPTVPEQPVEYVSKKDVAFGLLGAAAGYFALPALGLATGPIGAIILGIALLGMSAISRAVSRGKADKNPQQQQPGQMPQAPVYPQNRQQPVYQNQYNYQNNPNQQNDPRYRQPPANYRG